MQAVTITQINPNELETLIENSIKKVLGTQKSEQQTEPDRWFDLTELCNYLPDKPAKATAYGWVHTGAIPCHKGAKKLRFLKSEIDQWLKTGKRKTVAELASEADEYLKKKRGKAL
ncbi:MAG: helix-turn-helix domain-containing protein [Cyclobacteriaceae bacterium]|nr:helix-turn-helix domain-containing protein [Cyclobacteriaceae bacterium]